MKTDVKQESPWSTHAVALPKALPSYQDGNPIRLKAFATRDEAEEFIDLLEHDRTWAA